MSDARERIAELEAANDAYERGRDAVAELGDHEAVTDAHRRLTSLLDEYEGRATGTGDFRAYIEFQEKLTELVAELPEDLSHRDAFETVEEELDKRRLSEGDFDRARDLLAPAAGVVEQVAERDAALARYRKARTAATRERRAVNDRIAELERVRDLGDAYLELAADGADPDDRIAEIRDPIEAYNDAVRADFEAFRSEKPARAVVAFADSMDVQPLVDYRTPPADLRDFLGGNGAGEHPIPKLLEYADYSPSKLDHYVDDAMELKRHVATHRTYLERLDAGPLSVAWPPLAPAELRWRADELIPVVDRFAAPETVAKLRNVRELTREESWFERLGNAARAQEMLDAAHLDRLSAGRAGEELAAARAERDALDEALAAHPER